MEQRAQRLAQNIIAEMTERGVLPQPQERQQEEALLAHDANAERADSVGPSKTNESRDPNTQPIQGVDPYNQAQSAGTAAHEEVVILPAIPPRSSVIPKPTDPDEISYAPTPYVQALRDHELYE